MTDPSDRVRLLAAARAAIAAQVGGQPAPSLAGPEASRSAGVDDALARAGCAFVTIHLDGQLRGCIGELEPGRPLAQVVARCAAAACSRDPRFPPVKASELPHLVIELSVLGALEPVVSLDDIDIGRHGLVIERGRRRGLLLPQVATEWGWDRRSFVEQTCRKAGLPPDAWEQGATLWRFEAEVFGET